MIAIQHRFLSKFDIKKPFLYLFNINSNLTNKNAKKRRLNKFCDIMGENMIKGEALEQIKLFEICKYIKQCKYMFAVPNGGSRHPLEAVNMKRQGVKAGVPDICLPYPTKKYHGLYIEMKFGKNKPTQKQKEYIDYLNSVGYLAIVCYSCVEALDKIKRYIEGEL